MENPNMKQNKSGVLNVTVFNRHVPAVVSYTLMLVLVLTLAVVVFLYSGGGSTKKIVLNNGDGLETNFVYGSWPALENANFFNNTKQNFIDKKISFVEADLSSMTIRYYENGTLKKEAPITTKGREGSWWETPAGLYQISSKELNHFSSFGRVYMPYSMQFQGNFFIHGPTSYPDGTPTPSSYSGGCIRVGLEDVKEIYELVDKGTPLLVFEDSFVGNKGSFAYKSNIPIPDDVVYLAVDLDSNFVFAKNKAAEKRSIASITKLLSALVAVEYINVEKEVFITKPMLATTSIPRLKTGESVAVLDLLSLLLLESSNEAARAITTPLGETHFINLMNIKASAIGMADSEFVDSSGVLSGNISTAEDLFQLAKYLYFNRSFILHMSMGEENRIAYGPPRYTYLQNLNDIPGITNEVGGKVGVSTSAANSMLSVLELEINGEEHPVAIIVLGSDDAKRDIKTLLLHITNNFVPTKQENSD